MRFIITSTIILTSCANKIERNPVLLPETYSKIVLRAKETASWATWCEDYPSKENCNDGDTTAEASGFLCSVGFIPSCNAISRSVTEDGQLLRSPNRKDTENTASRDQLFGFFAAQINGENRWLDVKRFIKRHKRICLDATDSRCEMTPVTIAFMGMVHKFHGYSRDASMIFNQFIWDETLLAQAQTVPAGYQLNLVSEASWMAYRFDQETELSYAAAEIAFIREPSNPWFCTVVRGPDESCAQLALSLWPSEPEEKDQWTIARRIGDPSWEKSMGWEWLFIAGLYGVDLNLLEYSGKRHSKVYPQSH